MIEILADASRTGVVIVAAPEEMPVNETLELAGRLREETVVDLAAVVANRVLPELFGRGEEEIFDALNDRERSPALHEVLSAAVGGPVRELLDGAQLAVRMRDRKSTRLNSSHSCATRMPSSA